MAETLTDRIDQALKASMKSRDAARTSALRMARAALKNRAIEVRGELDDAEVVRVLGALAKQRRESIEQFRAGGREDLAAKEEQELAVLQEFLPRELSEDEVRRAVEEAVAEVDAQGPRDLGRVMSVLMPRLGGRADGRRVNEIVRSRLGGAS